MVYFTADLHLGHAAILKYCHRPFASVQEMDRTLIENWNRCVRDGDTVYVLGDMIWPKKKAPEYLAALKGNIILLRGNHDISWLKQTPCEGWPTQIQEYAKIRIAGRGVTLCHYPMLEWEDSRPQFSTKPGYLIHGHIHNNVLPEYTVILRQHHALNAGVDIKIVSDHLGHSNIGTTANIYADVLETSKRKTAEILELHLVKEA